jgi:hypothetical protein
VLGSTERAGYVNEPDDARQEPFVIRALAGQGPLPVLKADDPGSRELVRVWDAAFGTGPVRYVRGTQRWAKMILRHASNHERDQMISAKGRVSLRLRLAGRLGVPKHLGTPVDHHVVKSCYAPLMIEWIRARWDPAVVICLRHPLDVVASMLELDFLRGTGKAMLERLSSAARSYGTDVCGVPVPMGDDPVPYLAWNVGLVMSALDAARRENPAYRVVEHSELCADPIGQFRRLVDDLGLGWTTDTEAYLANSNRPGTGHERRRLAREQKDRWRTRLTPQQIDAARQVLARYPIAARYQADLAT